MSCRTTPAGKFSVSFLKNSYGFTESQSMSLFHSILRKHRESNLSEEEASFSYDRSITDFSSMVNRLPLTESKKERLSTKLRELSVSETESSHKFAITQLIRTGDTAKAMIDTSITLAHARQNSRMSLEEAKQNFINLLLEYKDNKEYLEENPEECNLEQLIEGYPQDKATVYAINAVNSGRRCIHCGRFVGAVTIHSCPLPSNTENLPDESEQRTLSQDGNSYSMAGVNPISGNAISYSPRTTRKGGYSEPVTPMSMEDFQDHYDAARARINSGLPVPVLPYSEDGYITAGIAQRNGGNTFGIELEVDFPFESNNNEDDYYDDSEPEFYSRHNLALELFNKGITISPSIQRWHFVGENDRPGGEYVDAVNGWICEFDRSVDPYEGARGVEIKSQILYDEPATWENIKKISESLSSHNARPTHRTGMHVNIGGSEFSNNNPTAHNSLLRLAASYDDVLIRLAHNPMSGKQHRGRSFCSSAYIPPEGYNSVGSARAHSNHYQAFNLGHLPSEGETHRASSRVEVRFWDGAIDLGRIQSAVAVSTALVELSLRNQEPYGEPQASGHHSRVFGTQKLEGENWEAATLSFRKFVTLMEIAGLKSETHKSALFHLFAESRWTRNN